jgi:N utilization substance protein A
MKSEFEIAITQLSADRNLAPEVILEAIEVALVSAYKRNYGTNQNVRVTIDPHTGQARVFVSKQVVKQVEDEHNEIELAMARGLKSDAALDELVEVEIQPRDFGRIAAQTAKQVITQRIREAERDSVYLEYAEREGEIVTGIVRNVDSRSRNVILSLGKAEALLARNEQIPGERYRFNQRLRVYIVSVERSGQGPQILVSRSHPELLRRLLELEVPEIYSGTVEVKGIAREPGARSKVAVAALQAGVDPVGSCVGMRGVRIQNIVNELNGEKIDVVEWSSTLETFIANALSPAKVLSVYLDPQEGTANVVVPDRSLSLAIGKEGQNARLAAKLTGWRIDIKNETEAAEQAEIMAAKLAEAAQRAAELEEARRAAAALLAEAEASLKAEEALAEGELDQEWSEEEAIARDVLGATAESEGELAPSEELAQAVSEASEAEVAEPEVLVEEAPEPAPVAETLEVEAEDETLAGWDQEALELEEQAVEEQPAPEAQDEVLEPEADELEPELEEEFEGQVEEDLAEGEQPSQGRKRRRRDRQLEYDERLGRVVARKRHKRSGGRDWSEDWDDNDG